MCVCVFVRAYITVHEELKQAVLNLNYLNLNLNYTPSFCLPLAAITALHSLT